MLWNWNVVDACFIAEGWHITNRGMFAATCIGIGLMAVLLEALRRVNRQYDTYLYAQLRRVPMSSSSDSGVNSSLDLTTGPSETKVGRFASVLQTPRSLRKHSGTAKRRITPIQQIVRVVLHVLIFGIAYLLMLLAMYYNGYVIISILLGTGLGKYLCDWIEVSEDDVGNMGKMGECPTVCCG
jgi:copper transporter 1